MTCSVVPAISDDAIALAAQQGPAADERRPLAWQGRFAPRGTLGVHRTKVASRAAPDRCYHRDRFGLALAAEGRFVGQTRTASAFGFLAAALFWFLGSDRARASSS